MPFPGAKDDVSERGKPGFQPSSVRIFSLAATSTPRSDLDRDCMPGDLAGGLDVLFHRESLTVAQIVGATALLQRGQGQDVRLGKIADVNVVAHAGAVGRWVVVDENAEVLALTKDFT